jgi:hypothetical protein
MHGFFFLQLKKYIEQKHGLTAWDELLQHSEVSQTQFSASDIYPDKDITSLLATAIDKWKLAPNDLLQDLGTFLVPDLLDVYKAYLNPSWCTLDLLAFTEQTMHRAVRTSTPTATPPILHVTRIGKDKIIIDYHSHRKMAFLAVGIIKGIAAHYKEEDKIEVQVKEYSEGERVQIEVHYINEQP